MSRQSLMSDIIPVHIYILTTKTKNGSKRRKENFIIIHKQHLSKAVASQKFSLRGTLWKLCILEDSEKTNINLPYPIDSLISLLSYIGFKSRRVSL